MTLALTQKKSEYSETNKKHILFWIMMVGFMMLIYVRNVMAIKFPVIILLAYACVMMLFADHDELVALAISLVPFSAAFQYKYAALAITAVYVLKYPKKIKSLYAFIPMALMLVWEMLHGIVGDFSVIEMMRSFAEITFCSLLISLSNKKFDYSFIARVYSICVVFACSVALLTLLSTVGYNFETIFLDGNYRFGTIDEEAGSYAMNYNANTLGLMCNLSIVGSLLRVRKKGVNIIDVALIAASVFFGILTLSRSFILCFVLMFVMLMFSDGKNIVKTAKNVLIFGVVAVVLFLVLNAAFPYVFENILIRFQEDDITGGRGDLMGWYNNFIFSSPHNMLFGTGLQDIFEKVNAGSAANAPYVPHNGTQEVVVVWGIPGLALVIYFIGVIIAESRKYMKKQTFINYIPLILVLIKVQSGQMITSGSTMLMFAFLYIILCTSFEKKKICEE